METYYVIYKTTNIVNNKIYIGKHQTKDLGDGYIGSGKYLYRAVEKYGSDKFKTEILYLFDSCDEMDKAENEIVNEEFVSRKDTYNLKVGGEGGFEYINSNGLNVCIGYKYINENGLNNKVNQCYIASNKIKEDPEYAEWFSKRISDGLREYFKDNDGWFKNGNHTEETKEKMRKSHKGKHVGKKNSQFGTCWIYSESYAESMKIKKEDLAIWLEKGWVKGRKMK